MMKRQYLLAILLVLILPVSIFAQFPSAIGTKWEYINFENTAWPWTWRNAFTDEIVGDSTINSVVYRHVSRTGTLTMNDFGTGLPFTYAEMDGDWFMRVTGDTVLILDSTNGSQNVERILFDFSLSPGDSVTQYYPMNLIDLTVDSTGYDLRYECSQMGPGGCSWMEFVLDSTSTPQSGPALHFDPNLGGNTMWWDPDLGALELFPYVVVLGIVNPDIYLRVLTSNGDTLYERNLASSSLREGAEIGVELYPNPAKDQVEISSEMPFMAYRLLGLEGKIQREKTGLNPVRQFRLDIGGLPQGLYLLQLQGNQGWLTRRLLIE